MDDLTAREALQPILDDLKRELHQGFPARITAYYPEKGTIDCEPGIMREVPGGANDPQLFEDLGELVNIPVQWPRGGGFVMTFPLKVGDWVHVHCTDQCLLAWREQALVHTTPGISDPHGLNGCFAVPGHYADKDRVSSPSTTDLVIAAEDGSTAIHMKPDGTVIVHAAATRIGAADAAHAIPMGDALQTWLAAMTVPTAMGPSGPPLNMADFQNVLSKKHHLDG